MAAAQAVKSKAQVVTEFLKDNEASWPGFHVDVSQIVGEHVKFKLNVDGEKQHDKTINEIYSKMDSRNANYDPIFVIGKIQKALSKLDEAKKAPPLPAPPAPPPPPPPPPPAKPPVGPVAPPVPPPRPAGPKPVPPKGIVFSDEVIAEYMKKNYPEGLTLADINKNIKEGNSAIIIEQVKKTYKEPIAYKLTLMHNPDGRVLTENLGKISKTYDEIKEEMKKLQEDINEPNQEVAVRQYKQDLLTRLKDTAKEALDTYDNMKGLQEIPTSRISAKQKKELISKLKI